jgi:aminobenzoyl-glutamate utilization protein A
MDFDSRNAGLMHACGHDGHTAMGMVLTRILYENRHLLKGRVKVVFQPAEEGVKGAFAMVQKGIADDADFALGLHIYPSDGPYTALAGTQTGLYATRKWDVKLTGKTAHAGGAPQEGNHAIMAAVNAISAMNGFLQDGRGVGRLNVGTIEGGTARNVIPGYCNFQAETRGSETIVEERIFEKAEGCVKAAAEMFGCEYEIKFTGMSPAGGGDEDLAAEIAAAAARLVPQLEKAAPVQVNTGTADDFCFFMERVHGRGGKACYMALQTPLAAGLHNSCYDFDDAVLMTGVKACISALHTVGTV